MKLTRLTQSVNMKVVNFSVANHVNGSITAHYLQQHSTHSVNSKDTEVN